MKHILTLLIMILTSSACFAQADLYVSDNSDAYVYVKNTLLFVNDNIKLPGADSNIYLRDEGQLLQKNETSKNDGLGYLSVIKDGTANKWVYNYWCSPVGEPTNTAQNEYFSMPRMQDSISLRGSQSFDFTPSSTYDGDDTTDPVEIANAWVYSYESSNSYSQWNFVGQSGQVNPGLGFTMKGTNANTTGFNRDIHGQRIDFRGKPNTGTIDVPVLAPISGDEQWTLTGNPYPSTLDMREIVWDADNLVNGVGGDADDIITGVFYYWDQFFLNNSHYIEDYIGGYATVTIANDGTVSSTAATYVLYDGNGNPLGGVAVSLRSIPGRYIPIGQGFMVEGKNNGDFKIKNSHRVYFKDVGLTSDNAVFRQNSASDINTENNSNTVLFNSVGADYKRFRLFVEFDGLYTRELLHNFHAQATDAYDYGLEAKSPEGVASDISWFVNNENYVIQANTFNTSYTIPLKIELTEQQSLNFRVDDIQHIDPSIPIFLHDIENDLYVNLRSQNYDLNLEAGTYSNRFEITFTSETLSLSDNEIINSLSIQQNNATQTLTILNPNLLKIYDYSLIDISGKLIFENSNATNQAEIKHNTSNLSTGVYILGIELNNRKFTKKVIIN